MSYSKGQRLVAYPDEPLLRRVFIEVTRCARDGSWVDVACHTWAVRWTKRVPTSVLDATTQPFDWTAATLDEQLAHYERVHTFDIPERVDELRSEQVLGDRRGRSWLRVRVVV